MDVKAQVTKWVEKKLGNIIDEDLKNKTVQECSTFNVHTYADSLEDKYFTKTEIERLYLTLPSDFQSGINNFDSYDSEEEENESKDYLEFDNHDFQTFTVDEIVKNLENDSKDVRIQALQNLEGCIEELIHLSSWVDVQKTLLKILKQRGDSKIHNLVLKVFFKFLTCTSKPQIVCEGFKTVAKTLSLLLTLKDDNVSYEEIYDLKGNRWLRKDIMSTNEEDKFEKSQKPVDVDVLIKSMWLLIHCQQQMLDKWIRFNEKRLKEIIFSFVHLLHSTNSEENKKLTSLELLSILNPTASWCRSWCHTAVGRNLLCSALRKYKHFFIHMVEIILNKIKTKRIKQSQSVRSNEVNVKNHSNKENKLSSHSPEIKTRDENYLKGRSKQVRSAPSDSAESDASFIFWRIKESSKWLTEDIPKRVVTEAMFWHSVSAVVCLIQFRSGQALFPIQTAARKRCLSVQDLSLSLIKYLERLEYNEFADQGFGYNVAYQSEVLKTIDILKTVRNNILSSKMKMERSPLSHR